MRKTWTAMTWAAAAAVVLSNATLAQKDDFQREGNRQQRVAKDALEGKAPPALQVGSWLNVDGESLALADLRGKVVVLDFWGTW